MSLAMVERETTAGRVEWDRSRRSVVDGPSPTRRRSVDALLLGHGVRFESLELAGTFVLVHGLEHHVVFELLADVGLQLESRHLQEADSLLQLRGHRQRLTQLQLQ